MAKRKAVVASGRVLTKAQHAKALKAAGTSSMNPFYFGLANKLGGYVVGEKLDLSDGEASLLGEWGIGE